VDDEEGEEMLCTCDAAEQGDTCKHMLKALMLRNPYLKKMQIIMALGTNRGRQPMFPVASL
jgi:hypothetical protein